VSGRRDGFSAAAQIWDFGKAIEAQLPHGVAFVLVLAANADDGSPLDASVASNLATREELARGLRACLVQLEGEA